MQYLVQHLLRDSAKRYPEKPALIQGALRFNFSQVDGISSAISCALTDGGICRHDRVGVFLDHSLNQVLSFFGILKCGGIYVPINSQLLEEQVGHIANDCTLSALIIDSKRLERVKGVLNSWGSVRVLIVVGKSPDWLKSGDFKVYSFEETVELAEKYPAPRDIGIGSDLAALLYTSGSTGKPKGVMVTHDNLISGARIVTSYLGNSHDDRLLGVLPLSFDYGLNQVICSALLGITYVMKSFVFPGELVKVLLEERITGFAGIPTIWLLLLQKGSPVYKNRFDDLRYITNSGGFLPVNAIEGLKKVFPKTEIVLMYGLTEAFRSTYLPPGELDVRPTSMGKAIPGCEILVINKEGKPCAPGEVGELVHRGPTVSQGYWGNEEKTKQVFRPNPLLPNELAGPERVVYSGDLVKKDKDGYLYFVGRGDYMIKSYGHRISPSEIEDVLYSTGRVKLAAAVGIPDAIRGQSIKVFAVPQINDGLTESDVLSICSEKLPQFMVPQAVEIVKDLPRTPTGKIDIASLRKVEVG